MADTLLKEVNPNGNAQAIVESDDDTCYFYRQDIANHLALTSCDDYGHFEHGALEPFCALASGKAPAVFVQIGLLKRKDTGKVIWRSQRDFRRWRSSNVSPLCF